MKVHVNYRTGMDNEVIPVTFSQGDRQFRILEILDASYGPDYLLFRVRANDYGLYLLYRYTDKKDWMADYLHERRISPRPDSEL